MTRPAPAALLYRLHELAFRTQYAELKDRTRVAGALLPGTPGTLYERHGTGNAQWYRVYYAAPGLQVEDWIGSGSDEAAVASATDQIAFAKWASKQVSDLRKLEFQVADKGVARVLVELHNRGVFEAGLIVVGTLCYMAWLNELGVRTVAARTQDVDLARRQRLKLAAAMPLLQALQATRLPFHPVPGLPSQVPSTSIKLPGRDGLRVDVLACGRALGASVPVPELEWHAQAVPFYDYLLDDPVPGAILAGGHCVPVRLPRAERWVWHKLYSSATRQGFPEKAAKDLLQGVTVAAVLTEQNDELLADSWGDAPASLRRAIRRRLPGIRRALVDHPQALEQFESCLT